MMAPPLADTVFAVAAGGRHAALTVIRLSGARCADILTSLGAPGSAPRMAVLRSLRDDAGRLLDRALVLWFPGPRSYTGEDCAELHLHGGGAVLEGVAHALSRLGARPAEAGEFTRRAFLNGRVDLLQAEAVADLVAAETDAQRDQALLQMRGKVSDIHAGWRLRLMRLMAVLEAQIDFPDEFAEAGPNRAVSEDLATLARELEDHLDRDRVSERLRDGLVFAVVGAPNVGKSTLVNVLCARDVSIVSAIPGTTRDVVEARTIIGGVPVTFVDTAGLRETGDEIEQEGMRRARERARAADLVVLVTDGQERPGEKALAFRPDSILLVRNKIDIGAAADGWHNVSAARGDGVSDLRAALAARARALAGSRHVPALTRPRHRAAVTDAAGHLRAAAALHDAEFAAEELRLGIRCLARIGEGIETEDVLDLVFRQFCIGK